MITEHWTGVEDGETLVPAENVEDHRKRGLIGPDAHRCCVIEGADWEECSAKLERHLGHDRKSVLLDLTSRDIGGGWNELAMEGDRLVWRRPDKEKGNPGVFVFHTDRAPSLFQPVVDTIKSRCPDALVLFRRLRYDDES